MLLQQDSDVIRTGFLQRTSSSLTELVLEIGTSG